MAAQDESSNRRRGVGAPPVDAADRLIEQGLDRYGAGELDAALAAWEEALKLRPGDPRAHEYAGYVRQNYELLRGPSVVGGEPEVPFGLEGEAGGDEDYELEVSYGDAADGAEPANEAYVEPVNEGWFLRDLASALPRRPLLVPAPAQAPARAEAEEGMTLEIEAEPGDGGDDEERTEAFERFGDAFAGLRSADVDAALPVQRPVLGEDVLGGGGDGDTASDGAGAIELEFSGVRDEKTLEVRRWGFGFGRRATTPPAPAPLPPALPAEESPTPTPTPTSLKATLRLGPGSLDLPRVEPPPAPEPARVASGRAPAEPTQIEASVEVDLDDPTVPGPELKGNFTPLPGTLSSETLRALVPGSHLEAALDAVDIDLPDPSGPADSSDLDDLGDGFGEALADGARDERDERGEPEDSDDDLTTDRGGATGWTAVKRRTDTLDFGESLDPEDRERTRERNVVTDGGSDDAPEPSRVPTLDLGRSGRAGTAPVQPLVIVEEPAMAPRPPRMPEAVAAGHDESFSGDVATVERSRRLLAELGLGPIGNAEAATMDAVGRELLGELERNAPADESADERLRRRIAALIERATAASRAGHHPLAVTALDLALEEEPDSAVSQKLIHRQRDLILDVYQAYIGDLAAVPALTMPIHELAGERLDNRAVFLLSRIDGALSFEELLDVAGMTRLETYRHLCRLLLRGIVCVR